MTPQSTQTGESRAVRLFRPRVILAVIMSVLLLTGGVAAVTQIATWTDETPNEVLGVAVDEESSVAFYVDEVGLTAYNYSSDSYLFQDDGAGTTSVEGGMSTDGEHVTYASSTTSFEIYDVDAQSTQTVTVPDTPNDPYTTIKNGLVYVAFETSNDNTGIRMYDLDTGTQQNEVVVPNSGIPEGIVVDNNDNAIVTYRFHADGIASVDPDSGVVNWQTSVSGGANKIAYDDYTGSIFLGDGDGDVKRFDPDTQTVTQTYAMFPSGENNIEGLYAANDIVTAGVSDGNVEIRDMDSNTTEVRLDGYDTEDAWVNGDGRTVVAVGREGGQGTAWDLDFEVPQPVDVTVQYQNGTAIADADVTIENDTGTVVASGQTDSSGVFSTSLPDGDYTAEATKTNHTVDTATFTVDGAAESITLTLQEIGAETDLQLHLDRWMPHNSSQPYVVTFTNETGQRSNVTTQATVTSDNASVVTVDAANYELDATGDESVAARANITANYTSGGVEYTATDYVAVANVTTSNLKVLPPAQRLQGTATDDTIYVIIIAAMLSVAATRFSSAFGGLSMGTMTMVVGYLGGYVGEGIAMLSLFTALFIGLNLAANIDYTVRR